MNAVEIEEAVSNLALLPFNKDEFPFAFLSAFGNKETTIKRLRAGASNKSDLGGILQTNNLHILVTSSGEVTLSTCQIFEYNLIELRRRLFEPQGLWLLLSDRKPFAHLEMIDELLALLVIGDLECERLVVDEAVGAGNTTHGALLLSVWFNPKFVGLQAFHTLNYICAIKVNHQIT